MILTAFISGILMTIGLGLIYRHLRTYIGEELHLSIDLAEQEALKAGKVINARLSKIKLLAEKAHGEVGATVRIIGKF